MRVIVYVPNVRGLGRTRQAVERDARAELGDVEVVGEVGTVDEARWARDHGQVDLIVGRPQHLLQLVQEAPDLRPWLRAVAPRPRMRGAVAGVLLAPAALLGTSRVGRAAAVGAGVTGAALAAVMLIPDEKPSPPRALPSPTSPSVPRTTRPPAPTPAPTGTIRPTRRAAESSGNAPAAVTGQSTGSSPPRTLPPSRSPTTSPPTTPTSPSASPHCIVDLDLLGIPVRLCLPQPS